jgi:colanic acid/amylovoran biosynthesis glycosyltransferase
MGVDMDRFTQRPVKVPGKPLQIISVARLTEKKGCMWPLSLPAAERTMAFHYRILGIGPWERRLRTLIEQYQLEDMSRCRASNRATRSKPCWMRRMSSCCLP